MTDSRPEPKRGVSFAAPTWDTKTPSAPPKAAAPASSSRPFRPNAARSASFAHPLRPSAARRPTAAARSLSFCDTRWTPSGRNLALRHESVSGPFAFLNPTTAIFDIWTDDGNELADISNPELGERARVKWNARDFRKGRHIFVLPRAAPLTSRLRNTSKPKRVLLGIGRMFTVFPYWDVSWLIGVSFTVGCLLFVACGFFYWMPIAYPGTTFTHEKDIAGGLTAFIGATLFQIGAVLLLLESYNDRAETKFGGALETWFAEKFKTRLGSQPPKEIPANGDASSSPTYPGSPSDEGESSMPSPPLPTEGNKEATAAAAQEKAAARAKSFSQRRIDENPFGEREWRWLPSWHDVKTHYIYEVGFLASFTMSLGATIFYICGILALPGIHLTKVEKQGAYYFPYLFGGVLFFLSSCLYILETQPNWYTPQPFKIGWHIGVFNMLGGLGWTLAASFGFCDPHWCKYQSELTLIWASCAFSFGSALQWYESLDKYVFVIED